MFFLIQAPEYDEYSGLIEQMHILRKRVFFDQLNWDVPIINGAEKDRYDSLEPAYLLWTDETATKLYCSLRLMVTTGPTLLNDVFRSTYPNNIDLCHPGIWEGTRLCIDTEKIAADMPEISPNNAMCRMLLALGECALSQNIHTMISNYEPHFKRIYQRAGAALDEIGRADGFGKRPVCCGVFEVSKSVVTKMRRVQNLHSKIFIPNSQINSQPYGLRENAVEWENHYNVAV